MESKTSQENLQKVNVTFGDNENTQSSQLEQTKTEKNYTYLDMSKDYLDEDPIDESQKFCVYSFLSPEGIMNCNIRAVKFRGAFPTIEKAKEHMQKLEKIDKYMKMWIAESGKWVEFDPPESKAETVETNNPEYKKIIDSQRAQRMSKLNELSGRYKNMVDTKEINAKERKDEYKKASAASNILEREKSKKQEKMEKKLEEHQQKVNENPRVTASRKTKERLLNRLKNKQDKKEQTSTDTNTKDTNTKETKQEVTDNLDTKIKVVGKARDQINEAKTKMATAEENIAKMREFLKNKNSK